MKSRGFTKFTNSHLDILFSSRMSASELRLLLYLYRMTKGYNRHGFFCNVALLADVLVLNRTSCHRTLSLLIKKGFVVEPKKNFLVPTFFSAK